MEDAIQFHSARSTIEERTTSNIYEIERIDHSKQVLVSKGRRERLRREIRPILLPRATETRTKTSSLSYLLSSLSLSFSVSYTDRRGKWRGIRKYICRDGFIRGGFDSLMAFVPLPREISNRAEICRCKTETYSAISCNNDNAPISRQPSPRVTSYYSGLDIVNPQK